MIRITKPAPPLVLSTRGQAAARAHCAEYDASSHAYRKGTKTFEFDSTIYAHDEVKAALRAAQHDKCAFCESLITHIGYGDIEHFRPKGGFKQREEGPLQRPGYYWLAYEWENLFLSCQLCNQKFKKNLFPLSTLSNRARSHNDDLTREDPLLLDPGIDDLDQHLRHVRGTVWAKNRSPRGRRTIEVLGLRRWELRRERLKLWQQLKATKDARDLLQKHSAKIPAGEFRETVAPLDQFLAEAILPSAPYAAMARTFLA